LAAQESSESLAPLEPVRTRRICELLLRSEGGAIPKAPEVLAILVETALVEWVAERAARGLRGVPPPEVHIPPAVDGLIHRHVCAYEVGMLHDDTNNARCGSRGERKRLPRVPGFAPKGFQEVHECQIRRIRHVLQAPLVGHVAVDDLR